MNENLNTPIGKEETYEQFETDENETSLKKINFLSPKNIIKYILTTFIILCIIILLFNLTQNKNITEIFESKSNPKKLASPINKDILKYKIEPQISENNISLDYTIKGTFISKQSTEHITLITILLLVETKCSKDNCLECYVNERIKYPELNDEEAFKKVYKEMGLRDTFVEKIYCQQHNPEMPKGDYRKQIHFVWNKYKREMIPLKDIYYIDDYFAKQINNEYLQAVIQGYEFTIIDHIYEKNNKNYKYNEKTLKFDEIKLDIKCKKNYECTIGDNEQCETCDSDDNKKCGSCNEGYYLSDDDKKICKKTSIDDEPGLSDKEAFDKIYKEMDLQDTYVKNVYCKEKNSNRIFFVWNKYKRKMILIKGVNDIDDVIDKTYNNEYLQAVIQGYEFTFMDHIYEKNKKYYIYNDKELIFNEIKFE